MIKKSLFESFLPTLLLVFTGIPSLAAEPDAGQPDKEEKGFLEAAAAEPKYQPGDFKPAPEHIETRFGSLRFPKGYPTEETVRADRNFLDRPPLGDTHLHTSVNALEAELTAAELQYVEDKEKVKAEWARQKQSVQDQIAKFKAELEMKGQQASEKLQKFDDELSDGLSQLKKAFTHLFS